MNILQNTWKGLKMTLTEGQRKFIEKAPKFIDDLYERLQNDEFQREWIKVTLEEFLADGDINVFVRCLTYVVQARGRGEISKLATASNIDRSNLSDILNGKVTPRIDTVLKLIKALGYEYEIILKSA